MGGKNFLYYHTEKKKQQNYFDIIIKWIPIKMEVKVFLSTYLHFIRFMLLVLYIPTYIIAYLNAHTLITITCNFFLSQQKLILYKKIYVTYVIISFLFLAIFLYCYRNFFFFSLMQKLVPFFIINVYCSAYVLFFLLNF